MYAIIRSGGKQYRAEIGSIIDVDRLPHEVGESIEISDVLLLATKTIRGSVGLWLTEHRYRQP